MPIRKLAQTLWVCLSVGCSTSGVLPDIQTKEQKNLPELASQLEERFRVSEIQSLNEKVTAKEVLISPEFSMETSKRASFKKKRSKNEESLPL